MFKYNNLLIISLLAACSKITTSYNDFDSGSNFGGNNNQIPDSGLLNYGGQGGQKNLGISGEGGKPIFEFGGDGGQLNMAGKGGIGGSFDFNEGGAAGQSSIQMPDIIRWDIGGQSNAEGFGALYDSNVSGAFIPSPLVTYYVDGQNLVFSPNTDGVLGRHGPELTIGNNSASLWNLPILINKSAVGAQTCNSLTIAYWAQHLQGIQAIKGKGTLDEAWIQGESDALQNTNSPATTQAYINCLSLYIGMIRNAFQGPVRFHILLLNPGLANWAGPGYNAIRQAQEMYVTTDSMSDLVSMDDIVPAVIPHYNSVQELEMGRRFVQARAKWITQ